MQNLGFGGKDRKTLWATGEGNIYRIAMQGKMDGTEVVQHYFLVAAPTGEQAVVTFSMTPRLVEKLGARDLNLVGGLLVPAGAP